MIQPLTHLNEFRKCLNQYYKSDQPFIYRTGAFLSHKAVSVITLPTNFIGGVTLSLGGIFKSCILKAYKIAYFKLLGHPSEIKHNASWWFNEAQGYFKDFGWDLYEHVEDFGTLIQKGYNVLCYIDQKVDLKSRIGSLPKSTLACLKRMESSVDCFLNLFHCKTA